VALTDDQKAMLKLLAQREDGYEDMAAVMGISVEEVRERVKEALAEVDEPTAVVAEPTEPPPPAPAPPPSLTPEPPQPTAEQPAAPTSPPVPPASTPAPAGRAASQPRAKRPSPLPRPKMPQDRGAAIGLGAGVLVLVAFAIVLLVAGGGGSNSSTTAASTETASGTPTAAESEGLTEAILTPTNGGEASGKALFGRYKKSVLLQVEADGLDPSPKGQSYAIWLYRSPKVALQIGAVPVTGSGKIATQFKIPAQLLAYIASGAFNQIDVSLITDATYKAAFEKAKKENRLPPYSGESVLRGQITGPAIKSQ
jgi:hypothetical protein